MLLPVDQQRGHLQSGREAYYLNRSVRQVHQDALGNGMKLKHVRVTGEGIAVTLCVLGTCLDQTLVVHRVLEAIEELDFLGQAGGVLFDCVVLLGHVRQHVVQAAEKRPDKLYTLVTPKILF